MKKKVISIILVLTIILPMLQPICLAVEEMQVESDKGIETVAGETLTDGDYQYTVENNEATITQYFGMDENAKIPETIKGYTVTSIVCTGFSRCESVEIPSTVTNIQGGGYASLFLTCQKLEDIIVDSNNPVYSSDNGVLYNKDKTSLMSCPRGKKGSFLIPEGVTFIKTYAFYQCTKLTNIIIPNSVEVISSGAFSECSNLTTLTIPDTPHLILGQHNFDGLTNLITLTIPESTGYTASAFYLSKCSTLVDATVSKAAQNDRIGIFDCVNLATINISDKVTNIVAIELKGCSNLKRIIIPENVTSIGSINVDTNDFAICGYENSYAQEFAQNNNIKFEIIGTEEPIKHYTITFQDYDGTVLKEQTVAEGGCGIEPKNLTREGYQFTGWDKALDNITSDRVVVAQYKKENYQEMLDVLPNEIQVDLKESEYEKVGDIVEPKIKEIWKQQGIDTTGVNSYCYVGMNSREALHTYRINIQYTIPNEGTKYKTKEIKIIYNNSSNYNVADEQAINSKIPEPKYLTIDFNKSSDLEETDNTVKEYYANSINDNSVDVKLFSGAGEYLLLNYEYGEGGPYVLLFKNDICYYANRIGNIPVVPQIIVPENVNDTEADYINYARPLIVQYLKDNNVDYVKDIENISIIKGGTVDWGNFYDSNTTKTFNVENGYTVTATTDWGEEQSTIILKKEKLNPPTPSVTKYTVTFKDYDGKVLKTETVEKGKSATAPTAPTREGYTFKGWDKSFNNVTSDVTITAQYEKQSEVKPIPNIDITPYMFNAIYYADMNPDLKTAFGYNETLLRNHYLTYGIKEGRRATPIFDPVYYLNNNGDVKKAFNNNYEQAYYHFINNGVTEGRQSSKFFSVTYYLSQNEDVKKAFSNNRTYAVMHFTNCGIAEGRKASKDFDVRTYVNKCSGYVKNTLGQNYIKYYAHAQGANVAENNPINISSYLFDAELYYSLYPDLQQAFGYNSEALKQHYLNCGIKEGRIASYVFNPVYYLNNNADVKKAFGAKGYEGAYNHFINNGIHEGRTGSQYFNVTYYLSQYGDLRNAFDTNCSKALEHFVTWGMNEGRNASKEFNAGNYKKRYTDLSKAFGNKWKEYYKHYAVYGEGEKRNCK